MGVTEPQETADPAIEPAIGTEHTRLIRTFWSLILALAGLGLIWLTFNQGVSLTGSDLGFWSVFAIVAAIAFIAEYADSSLGMGFGTILTPVLLILGFSPLQVVPSLLFSETVSGIVGGLLHHQFGNVDLSRGSQANKAMLVLAIFSVLGTTAAVIAAVSLPAFYVKLYIGVMIVAISLFLLVGGRLPGVYSLRKMVALGIIAAFNKAISGGGYGPLVTGGQVLLGVKEKSAIGTTTFAEGVVCLVALGLYFSVKGGALDLGLALPVVCGAIVSVPMAAWTVRVLPVRLLRRAMGFVTLFLGTLVLINLFVK